MSPARAVITGAVVVLLGLSGCACFCGDTGTREGARGFVFRCSTETSDADRAPDGNAEGGSDRQPLAEQRRQ